MALASATLGAQLASMGPIGSEAAAVSAFANAWTTYFSTAAAGPVPVLPSISAAPKTALTAAMSGFSTSSAAAIQAGIAAFWGALVSAPVTYFAGATLITPPPGLATLSANLVIAFATNTVAAASQSAAWNAIASIIHTANTGGMATIPTPTPTPTVIA